ncbi:monoacylglycerol lipase ABHD12 [Galendromus occidentalis]|uniref:Monoacylglycerol lipase ABHD12 n=1 Tax=Galendromus occidentalis TaxID=34638 RepID=A0AAJ7WH93_9ACAR|nr:monoacylglycerol lipase ABHD12 [Galendromus occidentalis]
MVRKRSRSLASELMKHDELNPVSLMGFYRRYGRHILRGLAIVYLAFPAVFFYSLRFRQIMIFGAFLTWPFHDYTKPNEYGLPHSKNFYVNSVGDIRLGVWYIPPKGIWEKLSSQNSGREPQPWMLDDNRPVIIYYHGHGQCRACDYRVGLYKTLTQSEELDAHLFTFDYRGFGDSTQVLPDREGLLHDSTVMFDYVRKLIKKNDSRILVWGHSLGTGVAVQLIEAFTELHRSPMGVVLEAPFNSLSEAASKWPISMPYRALPFMQKVVESVTNKLRDDDETFYETEQLAPSVNVPLLMIHSTDDALVPYELGQKLLRTLRVLAKGPIHFYQADDSYSLGHRYIFRDPKVKEVVADFIRRYGNVSMPAPKESAGRLEESSASGMRDAEPSANIEDGADSATVGDEGFETSEGAPGKSIESHDIPGDEL